MNISRTSAQPDAPNASPIHSPFQQWETDRFCEWRSEKDRPTLPAGHPDTWGLLIAGTPLEGEPYPFPVFWL